MKQQLKYTADMTQDQELDNNEQELDNTTQLTRQQSDLNLTRPLMRWPAVKQTFHNQLSNMTR